MRRALRRLALKGEATTEEDCYPLFDCFALGTGRVASVATAALPFVVAHADDPDMGARATLVELLASLSKAVAEADPGLVDPGWHQTWQAQRPQIRALLANPLPEVRRQALPLGEGVGVLLEQWHAETDPTVRLTASCQLKPTVTQQRR
ncbi:hypothetical protein FNH09_08105 [Streptomyces adustus]|uniref:HEAT repeat domain-containing protein n=1 Tax=Streptomyces adustus TaxID=1609272 RepID=A0A5N8V8P3_9ACTN|nr:hypothetical protein [Streptomyces adustus]MPY31266.1 hypothetical protein [Streptomyces adustus]